MTTIKIASNTETFVADKADTSYVLGEASTLWLSSEFGIDARSGADNMTFRIDGRILDSTSAGLQAGTFYGGLTSDNCNITIGKTGLIQSKDVAVTVYGDNAVIANNGNLLGDETVESDGISITGSHGKISNIGLVQAHYGIRMVGDGNEFNNSGHVVSLLAVDVETKAGETARIVNSGYLLSANSNAIYANAGEETVINSGQIHGNIMLLGGDDTFVNRGGHLGGTVHGGLGNDIYVVDSKGLQISEDMGEGYDRVKSSVAWTLDMNFEEGMLTGKKNVNLIGNDTGDVLYGNSGNNHIRGDMGTDFITGGRGNDTLTGGDGVNSGDTGDIFIFHHHSGADIITDFQDGTDKINLDAYTGIADFGDLTIKKSGEDVVVMLADGDSITLLHTSKAMITEADFQF